MTSIRKIPIELDDSGIYYSRGSSPVYTSETNNYIVGDRVWVNGTEPGFIQFIGDTEFAKGELAGIVLDEPVGKHNGTVRGVPYFQCEPKRGIFVRLHQLTRTPSDPIYNHLQDGGYTRNIRFSNKTGWTTSNNRNNRARSTSPSRDWTPRGRTTEIVKGNENIPHYMLPRNPTIKHSYGPAGDCKVHAKPQRKVYTSLATCLDRYKHQLRLHDKAMVNTNYGVKVGRVRYIGDADFGYDQYVGLELDEPYGKNDGSVDGIRYFSCPMKYGLFAPSNKVQVCKGDTRGCSVVH